MNASFDKATLRLFVTVEHPCNYLPERNARNLVADPDVIDQGVYRELANLGFRRSGDHVYRPYCSDCSACLSLRVPVALFRRNRTQRRNWIKNQDLQVHRQHCRFDAEHYALFSRYVKSRHRNGGMDDTSAKHYVAFINSSWGNTALYEIRQGRQLLAVAVVDELDDAFSAVYTFFDPTASARGLGTYAILWQINEAQRLGKTWAYLGYWIKGCTKMDYKSNFRPHEIFRGGRWLAVSN